MASNPNFEAQAQLGTNAANQARMQLENQERQERKLISTLLHGTDSLTQRDVNISDNERDLVYQELSDGHIDTAHKSHIIQEIATPFHLSPERAIDQISTKHERRILTYLSGTGFDYWESASIYDLQNALRRFPTPYELAETEKDFLENIRAHNSPQKYAEYQDAMESFKQKTYGKRYEYYNAMESLQHKADQKSAENASRTQVLNTYTKTNTAPVSSTTPETITQSIELHQLDSKEQKKILKNSQIDGDNFLYNGQSYQLTTEGLERLGLAPNYSFQLKNAQINLSNPYKVGSHSAVTAYVQTKKGTKVCSYYRSNSQGIWRLLPDYVSDPTDPNSAIDWFGKGYDEESLNLPSETQYALEIITQNHPNTDIDRINAEFAFAGTAKRYNSKDEYAQYKAQHALRGQHYTEVDKAPIFSLGKISYDKAAPETLDLSGPSAPDFNQSQNPYTTNTSIYGQVHVEHIPSKDNTLQYTFNRNTADQAWLGGIEVKSADISSFGLRTEWASAGDYGTPLYEYRSQSDIYGDYNDSKGNYVSMWKNYLSRMPLIRRYLANRPQRA